MQPLGIVVDPAHEDRRCIADLPEQHPVKEVVSPAIADALDVLFASPYEARYSATGRPPTSTW